MGDSPSFPRNRTHRDGDLASRSAPQELKMVKNLSWRIGESSVESVVSGGKSNKAHVFCTVACLI